MDKRIFNRIIGSQALASAALSLDTPAKGNFRLLQVLISASVAITETVTITFKSKDGTNYDTALDTTNLTTASSFVFRPSGHCVFSDGDYLNVAVTNGNTTGVVYATILIEPLGMQK
jgi:hypothetical protein